MSQLVLPDRNIKPAHGKPISLIVADPEMIFLDNGLQTYLIRSGGEEVTKIDISVKAGSAFQHKKLIANSTGKLLMEGTSRLSSVVIAEKLDFYGSHLEVNVNTDTVVITLYSLTKHLTKLLPLLGELITGPNFPQNELVNHLDRKRQEFLVNNEKVRYVAMNEFSKLVFGASSAYGQTLEIDDFEQVTREDLIDFYKKYYVPERAYLVISGKIDDAVLKLINNHLGKEWSKNNGLTEKINFTEPVSERRKIVLKPEALQSAIRIGRPIIDKKHPDHNKFILLNTILGGYFGSRLMSNLREEKGLTYGISSYIVNYVHGSFFSVSTEVNASQTELALLECRKEMELLRNEKIKDKELKLVKNYIYGTFLRNFDGPFALADRFRAVRDFGLGFDHYMNGLEEIMQINADQLLDSARNYLNPDDMITLVVGKIN